MAGRGGKQRVEDVGRETRAGEREGVARPISRGKKLEDGGTEGEDAGRKGKRKGG